jgi:PAS domain-containing protein
MPDSHLPPPPDPLRRWLVRAPVSVALVLTAAIIAASGVVGYWNAHTLAATGTELAEASARAAALESLQAALLDAENAHLRQALDGSDPQARISVVRRQLQRLMATAPPPGARRMRGQGTAGDPTWQDVRRRTEAAVAIWARAEAMSEAGRADEALLLLTPRDGAPQQALLQLLARLHEEQSARLLQLRQHNDAAARRGVWGASLVAALALLSLAAFAAVVRRSRSRLQESQHRFRQLAETMPQLAWIAREDGYITWYNQRWYDYTGTTPEQMEGWGWQAVHDAAELPRVMEA